MRIFNVLIMIACLFAIACSKSEDRPHSPAPATGKNSKNVVLFLGDSLTAGYRLAKEQAYPALISELWRQQNVPFRAKNGAVSGYTSTNVLANLDWWLGENVHTVFLAIGANDGLRGQDLNQLEQNISQIIKRCRQAGAQVVLAGMKLPPNYGAYAQKFAAVYSQISRKMTVKQMPFLLRDVAGRPEYNLPDGIHPNPEGHKLIARTVLNFFRTEEVLP